MIVRFKKNGKQVFSVLTFDFERASHLVQERGISYDSYKIVSIWIIAYLAYHIYNRLFIEQFTYIKGATYEKDNINNRTNNHPNRLPTH